MIIVACEAAVSSNQQKKEQIEKKGAEILTFPDLQGKSNLHFVLDELSNRGVAQGLVEGGPKVISSFLKEKLADEICVYVAPRILGTQGGAEINSLLNQLSQAVELNHVDIKSFDQDVRIRGLSKETFKELSSYRYNP